MTSTLRRSLTLAAVALAACGTKTPPAPPADPHAGHDHGAPQALFVNGDFEDGTLTGWTVTTNRNTGITTFPPTTLSHLNLQTGGTARTAVRTGATETVIPAGLTAAESLRIPKYGTSAVGVNETGASNNVNSLVQAMTTTNADVDPADGKVHVRFAVAPVLQNPGHTNVQQPYFWVQLRNVTKGTMLFQTFNFANQPGVPWKNNAGGTIQYTDWQAFDISPGPAQLAVGDQVEITVLAAGCSLGGHWGEVYVDAFGPALPGLQVAASAPASVNTGAQLTYTLAYSNGGAAAAADVTVTENLPAGTTFASVNAPGASCTTPAVGGTGAVTCNVGTVNPSSSGSFTVTVTVTAAAGGTVSNGNYTIAATGVSPLIGPLVTTSVTAGVTYADLATTATDGVAAVGWGTATTYAVTVSNAGPSAANGATLSVPLPANLASMSWTCSGQGGATCGAASGSGAIATTANLPSGGQATWTISATVAAGSGSGTVALIATAATPAGVTDSAPSNNVAADYDQVGTLRTLTVTKAGTGAGSVVSAPAAISCGTGCSSQSAVFLDGAAVALTASAGAGNRFLSWTAGPCAGSTSPSCVVPIAADTTVTADFMAGDWLVTGSAPAGNGSVSCTTPVLDGQPSTCTIAPAARHRLTALTDNGADVLASVSGGAYLIGAVTGDHAVVGTFTANTSALSLAAGPAASVVGQPVTFTATATGTAPAGTPTGAVDFTAAGLAIPGCTAVPLVAGAAACTTSALPVGTTSVQAASSGDATWPPAASTPIAYVVGQAATTLALASSANPASHGATPTVTATVLVTGPGAATPTGTVSFSVDGSPLGSVAVSGGAASLALPLLGAGTHAVAASYSGDASLIGSAAPQLDQVITRAATLTALDAGTNPSVVGQVASWQVTVSSAAGTPTGNVTFSFDGAAVATLPLDAAGQAELTSAALAVGPHAVSVSYAGDANFAASSGSVTQSVAKAATTLALASSANPATYGATPTVTATVSVTAPGSATPSGTVTFAVDGSPVGSAAVAGGQASLALPVLGAGTHAVTASYSGDGSLTGSAAPQLDQVVAQATPAVAVASSASPSVAGQPVTWTATVSSSTRTPTGSVTFAIDGAPVATVALDASGQAGFTSAALAVGDHGVSADYAGDADFGAASASLTQAVGRAATTLALFSSDNPSVYGLTGTVTGMISVTAPGDATPAGSITFSVDGSPIGTVPVVGSQAMLALPILSAGTHAVTASYAGDANLLASTAPQLDQEVGRAEPAVAVAPSANPSVAGQAVSWQVTVSSPVSTPTGEVTISVDGAPVATVALDAAGQATHSSAALAVGDHTVSVSYAGDANFAATSCALTQTVGKATSALALASSENPATHGATPTVTATVSVAAPGNATPTGTVAFAVDGAPIGSAAVAGGQASLALPLLGAGTHAVTASYSGDASLTGSAAPQLDQAIGQATPAVAVAADVNPSVFGEAVTWTVTVASPVSTPTGSVTLSAGGIPVATVPLDAAGVASFSSAALPVGSHALQATYSGDADFAPGADALTQVVGQAASTVALAAPAASVYGEAVALTATVSAVGPGAGAPSGAVRFLDGGVLIGTATLSGGVAILSTTTLPPGSRTLTAEYLGDASFAAAGDGAASHDVVAAAVQLVLAASPATSAFGEPVTWTVTATADAPSTAVPQGTVTVAAGGVVLGQALLDAAGQATLASAALPVGLHDVTATLAGGPAFAGAVSAPLAQEVVRAATATALASSLPASTFGEPVTLTATVSAVAPGAGTPSGVVTFLDGGAIIGTGTLTGGVATLTLDTLGAGLHDLTVQYAGDVGFEPSATAAPEVQSVSRAAAAVAVATAPETTVFGQAVVVSVSVTSAAFIPAGQVAVEVDGAVVAMLPLDAAGLATFSTAALAVGPHDVLVHYLGAADWDPADSALGVHPVDKAPTAVSLAASPQPSEVGQPVTLTATVSVPGPGAGVPTGTVTFLDAGAVVGTGTLAADGTATLQLDTFQAGAHDLTVSYGGDGSFLGAATPPGAGTPHAVEQGAVTVTVASDPSPSVAGQPVTVSVEVAAVAPAAGVPSGTVILTDGGTTLATLTLQGGAASTATAALAVGAHPLQVAYAGDTSFLAGTGQATHAVGQAATTTVLASSASPSRFGQPVTWTATVSVTGPGAGTPTGTVTFRDGATVLGTATLAADGTATVGSAALAAGDHPLTADYAGDASFSGSSGALAQQVAPAATTLALAASPSPAMFGQQVTLTATVAPVAPGAGTPDGTVTFQDGATTLGTAALSGGVATLTTSDLAAGAHGLSASYGGAAGYEPSAGGASLTVEQGSVAVAVASSRNPSRRGRDVTFTATLTSPHAVPGGTVTFKDGEVVLGTAPLAGGVATLTSWNLVKGDHPVSVEYDGAADFAGAIGTLPGGQVVENTPPAAGSGTALVLGPAAATSAAIAGPVLDQATGTLELWFRTGWTDAAEVTGPVTLLRLGDGASPRLLVTIAADRQALTAAVGAANASSGPAAADGAWHHLAIVSDGASTTFALDGTPFGGVEASLASGTGGGILVGDGFVGEVDELRVWTTARTPAELAAALRRPPSGDEPGLAGLWRLDEGGGDELFDGTAAHRTGAVALAAGAAPDAAFTASSAWAHRDVWQEREMDPADAGYDADGDPLALAVIAAPAHGTGSADAAALTVGYRAGPGWLGPDQLAFQLDDGAAASAYQLEIDVHRVLLCAGSADCGGGDLCVQGLCVAPSDLSGRAGGCGCTSGGGGAAALWSLLALALASRRRRRS